MNFGTYDFETYAWNRPICVGVHCEKESDFYLNKKDFESVPQYAINLLERMTFEHDVKQWWAHNGGKFDSLFIVDALKHFPGWRCDGAVAGGRIVSLRIISPRVTFELKDSFAVIQSSLEKALESFEIPVKKVFSKFDYEAIKTCQACEEVTAGFEAMSRHKCMLSQSDDKLEKGCLADCAALHGLLVKAENLFLDWGGELKGTFSASALTVVKASIGRELPSHKGQQALNERCRNAYHGGRVEVFIHAPSETLREYDVTSSYPWSMTQKLPWDLLGHGEPKIFDENVMSIVYATVRVPEQKYPPLPFVPRTGGLFFPYGQWSGWFTSVELAYAIERCGVDAVFHDAINYTAESPFVDFIENVFETKANSTGALREFCKLVMNGCYGKFGQKPENVKLKVFPTKEEALAWQFKNHAKQPTVLNRDTGTAISVTEFRWPKQTHYALASTITAHSRILLHKLFHGKDIAYCDTDAVHTKRHPKLDKKVSADLGGLKIEEDSFKAKFYAPKLYKLTRRENFKTCPACEEVKEGEKARSKHICPVYKSKGFYVSGDAFEKIVTGQLVGNPNGRMQLIKTQLKKGNGVQHLSTVDTEKMWSGRSNKRRVSSNSPTGETAPWNVRELLEGVHLEQQSPIALSLS